MIPKERKEAQGNDRYGARLCFAPTIGNIYVRSFSCRFQKRVKTSYPNLEREMKQDLQWSYVCRENTEGAIRNTPILYPLDA